MPDQPTHMLHGDESPPEWLTECLWMARPAAVEETMSASGQVESSQFVSRCVDAAKLGLQLSKLQTAATSDQPFLLPVVEFVQQLARSASVAFTAIAAWAGLDSPPTTTSFANGWAKLAGALGCDRQEALSRLRLSFLSATQPDLLPLPTALRGTGNSRASDRAEFQAYMAEALSGLPTALQTQLNQIELDFVRAFAAAPHGADKP